VVSTPYWHAKEMLADGRGRLVGVGDIKALSRTISELLGDEVERTRIRKQAFHYCRNMIWPKVARRYLDLFDEVRSRMATSIPVASSISRKISVSNIPTPRLDHVVRLSDDTGICHYAVRALPNWSFGYHLEDQATALVVASKFYKVFGTNLASSLAERYLRLIYFLLDQPNGVAGRLSYSRNVLEPATVSAVAKSVWALGYTVSNGPPLASETANDLFNDVMSSKAFDDANALPYVILGSADYLTRFPGASQIRRGLKRHAESLSTLVQNTDWSTWWQTSDMAVPIQALAVASLSLNSNELKILAQKMIDDLLRETCDGTVFLTRGNNPQEEELPVSVMSFIDALGALSKLNEDRSLLTAIRSAANWFLGENRRRTALYDFKAGSCSDALTASGPNENQGAESTLACLISFLTLYELASADL
jgi:hypothetical protein